MIMLTAKGETFDKVLGLELGADDYVVKPFDSKEVVARIKAVLRRCNATAQEDTEGRIEYDNFSLDMSRYELKIGGKVVEAPPKELELLSFLASHPNRVLPGTSCWTRYGDLSITAIPAPSTCTSSACGKSWRVPATSGA